MSQLSKLAKVNENISINRYDNGWMIEIGGCQPPKQNVIINI